MNTLCFSSGAQRKFLAIRAVFAAGLFGVGAASAFAASELPLVSVDVDKGVITSATHAGVGAAVPAGATAKPKTSKNTVQDAQSQMVYTITVRNLSSFPANNLAVEYHFYNRTSANNAGTTTVTVDDITNTVNVNVPVNGKEDIKTTGISHEVKQTYAQNATGGTVSAKSGKSGGTMSTGQTDVTTTRVMGYVIIIRSGSTIVKTVLSDPDIVSQVKAIQAKAASSQ